ncbi:MAG: carbohydrate ABC transporter permease [Alphaproteobacteria bacterium]
MSLQHLRARGAAARRRRRTVLLTCGGILVAIYVLAPFSWLVLTSFMHERDALAAPPHWIPKDATLDNYRTFFDPTGVRAVVGSRAAEQTLPSMANSLIAAVGTAVLNLVLGTLAGYSFARLKFPGRTPLLVLYLGSRMVPGIALIVPLYLTIKTYGLLDNLVSLVITYLTFTLPFTIWLLKSYFQGIPRSLEEAALIDGCTWPQMVVRILIPAALPGLAAAAMFAFMTAWNDYLFAVILTTTMAAKTIPVVVAGFATDVTTERTLMATGGVLAVIPPLVLAFLFQRLIVQGLTAGAVKE